MFIRIKKRKPTLETSFIEGDIYTFKYLLETGCKPTKKFLHGLHIRLPYLFIQQYFSIKTLQLFIISLRYRLIDKELFIKRYKYMYKKNTPEDCGNPKKLKTMNQINYLVENPSIVDININETLFQKCYFLNYVTNKYKFHDDIEESGQKYLSNYFDITKYFEIIRSKYGIFTSINDKYSLIINDKYLDPNNN